MGIEVVSLNNLTASDIVTNPVVAKAISDRIHESMKEFPGDKENDVITLCFIDGGYTCDQMERIFDISEADMLDIINSSLNGLKQREHYEKGQRNS